jgi:hypothetical protein
MIVQQSSCQAGVLSNPLKNCNELMSLRGSVAAVACRFANKCIKIKQVKRQAMTISLAQRGSGLWPVVVIQHADGSTIEVFILVT